MPLNCPIGYNNKKPIYPILSYTRLSFGVNCSLRTSAHQWSNVCISHHWPSLYAFNSICKLSVSNLASSNKFALCILQSNYLLMAVELTSLSLPVNGRTQSPWMSYTPLWVRVYLPNNRWHVVMKSARSSGAFTGGNLHQFACVIFI